MLDAALIHKATSSDCTAPRRPIGLWSGVVGAAILSAMHTLALLRTGLVVGFAVSIGMIACGSSDEVKKVPGEPGGAGDGGASDGGATANGGLAASEVGGGNEGGAENPGTSGRAGAGNASGNDGGAGGAGPSAGAGGLNANAGAGGADDVCLDDAPGTLCPAGSADCDDDPSDCETNTTSDTANCGRCARACGGDAACTNGLCAATVLLDPNVSSNWCSGAFTATTAYMITCWGNNDLSEVRSAPLEPGANVLGTGIKSYNNVSVVAMRGLVVDGNDVLFGLQESPSHLYKFPLDADGPEDVSVGYTFENNQRFDDLQLIGDTFWWNHNTHTTPGNIQPSTIEKRTKSAANSTVLVSGLGQSYNLRVFTDQLLWLEQRTQQSVTSVYRSPVAGAAVADTELVAVATPGAYMRQQGDYVYWTHKAAAPNGKLRRLKADAPANEIEDIATSLNLPEGLVVDSKYAYFKQVDALYRVPLCGGTPQQLSPVVPAHDAQATQIFHVDDKYVYFAAGAGFGQSTLVRVAK